MTEKQLARQLQMLKKQIVTAKRIIEEVKPMEKNSRPGTLIVLDMNVMLNKKDVLNIMEYGLKQLYEECYEVIAKMEGMKL